MLMLTLPETVHVLNANILDVSPYLAHRDLHIVCGFEQHEFGMIAPPV